jgi:putative OPT family oligopeptide transporter
MNHASQSYISPHTKLPEITVKAVLLSAALSIILSGANAYLGLFAGMTVSASIPASVISLALLRLFRNSNILENNMVQTASSAGESLAAGVVFTLPALILMGYWETFTFWETTLIIGTGGLLGVLFTIPLRNALIIRQGLRFPEGVATAEVLKTGEEGGQSVKYLARAAGLAALFKLGQGGFNLWRDQMVGAKLLGQKGLAYFGLNLSPALVAVGYIVGLNIALLVFIGGAITWLIAIPAYLGWNGMEPVVNELIAAGQLSKPAGEVGGQELAMALWSYKLRYLGVGAMVVGGIWALVSIRKSLVDAVQSGLSALKTTKDQAKEVLRTEVDTPISWVLMGIGILMVPIFIIYLREIQAVEFSLVLTLLMVVAGFLFSAVAGYMAGLVGSSNNPISGVTIATILATSLILVALMGTGSEVGPAGAILVGAVVCCAAAIAGDNMQDLKAGNILGATPYKQQAMQMIGVVAAALTLPLTMNLLNTSYGFGPGTPLLAPQATLMKSVAQGVFGGDLPWPIMITGMGIAILIIIADQLLAARGATFRMPVLAVAVGLYLPFSLDTAILLGGLVAWMLGRFQQRNGGQWDAASQDRKVQAGNRGGLLFASGLITGEALIGIVLALPIAITGQRDILELIPEPLGSWPGVLFLGLIIWLLYRTGVKAFQHTS